ncbi:hypothetical protein F5X96DRAFT_691612 [Biscogniauxia mediterranea]|nr:hypothetical protein F5X96DRAFT_691612 [Biscogniauxia mediterranea]
MNSEPAVVKRALDAQQALKAAFPGRVTIAADSSSKYEAERTRAWSQTCWSPATAYVHLTSAQEVADALAIIKRTGSKFVIRTTGNNPNPGFSSIDESGVVLDLSQMNSKSLDADNVLHAGAGCTWGEVYAYLEEKKRSVTGARDETIGLGGFLLGGGLPAFPNLHGLGSDGVKNFEVVLADSRIVNANASTHEDLYRALKGGGSNFGVVTRFDLETYPLIQTQYTINLYNPSDYVNILKATVETQEALDVDPKAGLFTNFTTNYAAVGLLYADVPAEKPRAFSPFSSLTSLIKTATPTTNGTILSLAKAMAYPKDCNKRAISTVATKVSNDLYAEVHKAWLDATKKLPPGTTLSYTIQPVSKAAVRAGKDRGGNILGLEEVSQTWWVFTAEWPKTGDNTPAQKAVDDISQNVRSLAREKGQLLEHTPMNFANSSQNVLRSYGVQSIKPLMGASSQYDPEGLFQKYQNDGFLLRNL